MTPYSYKLNAANADFLLAALEQNSASWDASLQTNMRRFLCNEMPIRELATMGYALMAKIDESHILTSSHWDPNNLASPLDLWTAPLLKWGLNQPWFDQINSTALLDNWRRMQPHQGNELTPERAVMLLDAVDHLEITQNTSIAVETTFANEMYTMCTTGVTWSALCQFMMPSDVAHSLISLGVASLRCSSNEMKSWFDTAGLTFPGLARRVENFQAIFDTPLLPDDYKTEYLRHLRARDWLSYPAKEQLEYYLPEDELSRIEYLPFDDYAMVTNQQIMATYCPTTMSLLQALAEDNDWDSSGWIYSLKYSLAGQPSQRECLPLPDDLTP